MITPLFAENYEPPKAPEMGAMARLLYYTGTALPETFRQTANSTSQLLYEEDTFGQDLAPPLLPPAQTTGQGAADLVGGLLPYLGSVTGVGGAVRAIPGMARLATAAPLAAKSITGSASFGLPAAQQGRDVALEQALEGAVLGPIEAIPSRLARMPFTAALGYGSNAFFDSKHPEPIIGDWDAGDIAGWSNFLAPLLPGVKRKPLLPNRFQQPSNPWTSTANMAPEVPPSFYEPGGMRPSTGVQHDPSVTGDPTIMQMMGQPVTTSNPMASALRPEVAENSAIDAAARMQAAQAERLQQLQFIGLMPAENPGLTVQELAIKQKLELAKLNRAPVTVDPNLPPHLQGISPEIFGPEWSHLGTIPTKPEVPTQMFESLLSSEYRELGQPKPSALSQLPFEAEFQSAKQQASSGQREELLKLARWTAGLADDPILSPSGDAFEEVIRKGTAPVANPIHDVERVATRKKLDDLIAERQYIAESEAGDPYSVGVAGLDKAIKMLRKKLDESAQTSPELLHALGMGGIRAGVGATIGGMVAEEKGIDPAMAMIGGAATMAFGPLIAKHGIAAVQRLKKFGAFGAEGGAIGSKGGMRPAFRLEDGTIISPPEARAHFQVLQNMSEEQIMHPATTDGFVTESGEFLTREQAHVKMMEASPAYRKETDRWETRGPAQLDSRDLPLIERDLQSMQNKNPDAWTAESGGIANPFNKGLPDKMKSGVEVTEDSFYADLTHPKIRNAGIVGGDHVPGKGLFVTHSEIEKDLRGKGFGLHLYDKLMDKAAELGVPLYSDAIVSIEAGRVYESLAKRGYKVTKHPDARIIPGVVDPNNPEVGGLSTYGKGESNGHPVFTVEHTPETLQALQKGMKRGTGQGGFTTDEMRAALGRAAFGGFVGGTAGALTDDPGSNNNMAIGVVSGVLGGLLGPSAIRLALEKPKPGALKAMGDTGFDIGNLIAEAKLNKFNNADGLSDRVVARLDDYFGISRNETWKRMLGDARGAAVRHIETIDNSFRELSIYNVDQQTKDATNAFLDGRDTQAVFLAKLAPTIAVDPKVQSYADFAINARTAVDGLIEVGSKGLGNSAREAMMRQSMGKYLRQSYKVFTDPKYKPSESSIQALTAKIQQSGMWGPNIDPAQITRSLREWVEDVQRVKGVYKPTTVEAKAIDQNLFKHRKVLGDEFKAFLGEITDPIDRIHHTVLKLRPLAETSDLMRQLIAGTKSAEGLPHLIPDQATHKAERAKVLQALQNAPAELIPSLQRKVNELDQYRFIKNSERYGAIKGQLVHRTVAEVLDSWDEAAAADGPIIRTMLGLNSFMKANVTYRNPLGIIKQFATAPFFMQIGRAQWSMLPEAIRAMRDQNHPAHAELVERGIIGVDSITRDVERELNGISHGMLSAAGSPQGAMAFLGRIDGQIGLAGEQINRFDMKAADLFRMPDNAVRATTYLSAKTRFAKELGFALDDPIIKNKAVEFTNRYTMNYEHLPEIVKLGRKVPGMNLFLAYTYEMGRILKNLGEDVIKGDSEISGQGARLNATMALGFMAALPETLQSVGESKLSSKDKDDWDLVKKNLPGYARNRFYFVTGRDSKTKQFKYIDFTPLIPIDQFSQTVRGIGSGDLDAAKATNPVASLSNSPMINVWQTVSTGQNVHTKARSRGWQDTVANVASEVGGPMTPGTGSIWRDLRQSFSENAEGELGVTDKNGRTKTPYDIIPWAVGAKSGTYSLDVQKNKAIAEYKQNVAEEMHYLNDVLKSNIRDEKKQIATDRTKKSIIALKRQLAERLGIAP